MQNIKNRSQNIKPLLKTLDSVPGRGEVLNTNLKCPTIIIDYAHTPDGLCGALTALKDHFSGQIWCIFGCGGNRDIEKRILMGQIAHQNSDLVIVTDDNPRDELPSKIREDILQGCPNAIEIGDRNSAIKFAVSKLQDNDLLLIAGKGHESTQTIGMESLPFDDYTVSKEAIKNIKKIGITS